MAAHYLNEEQLLCAIDGYMTVKLVPHIFRQELYAGKDLIIRDEERDEDQPPRKKKIPDTCSPIDFFDPDLDNYPLFLEAERRYTVLLHDGDCLFIPAYYFYTFGGKAES